MHILRTGDVIRCTGLSRATIWRKEREGTFPKRIQLGPNSVGWRSDEVEAWIDSCPRPVESTEGGDNVAA